MTVVNALDLEKLILAKGAHAPDSTFCVMEAVAFVAGEPWSDHPKCASIVIGEFLRLWNDGLNDEDRQMLKPLIPRLVGTAGDAATERKRSYMALDWLCRTSAPTWLRLIGKKVEAKALEDCAPIVDTKSARAASAAGAAARDAAWDTARAAAGAAAWDTVKPTVVVLQKSALQLVERMIAA